MSSSVQSIVPIFRSHYSLDSTSLLTLEPPGSAKPGSPISIFDLAKEDPSLKTITVVDTRIDGFISAYKAAAKLGITLCYGIKLTVCADRADRALDSRRTESKVIILLTGGGEQPYKDLVRIWNRSWGPEGHVTFRFAGEDHSYGRADWAMLREYWTENLTLALPYTSSFVARNALGFNRVTPDLPVSPYILREIDSGLPFSPSIDAALDRFVAATPELAARVVPTKTVCYNKRADFKAYQVLRAIMEGGTFEDPKVRHLCSDSWCWESYKELVKL